MGAEYYQSDSWSRETGEAVVARSYADETMTIAVYPSERMNDLQTALNLSLDTWREISAEAGRDTDEIAIEESRHENVTVRFTDGEIVVISNYSSNPLHLAVDEVDNALDHAREVRDRFEYDGIV